MVIFGYFCWSENYFEGYFIVAWKLDFFRQGPFTNDGVLWKQILTKGEKVRVPKDRFYLWIVPYALWIEISDLLRFFNIWEKKKSFQKGLKLLKYIGLWSLTHQLGFLLLFIMGKMDLLWIWWKFVLEVLIENMLIGIFIYFFGPRKKISETNMLPLSDMLSSLNLSSKAPILWVQILLRIIQGVNVIILKLEFSLNFVL